MVAGECVWYSVGDYPIEVVLIGRVDDGFWFCGAPQIGEQGILTKNLYPNKQGALVVHLHSLERSMRLLKERAGEIYERQPRALFDDIQARIEAVSREAYPGLWLNR